MPPHCLCCANADQEAKNPESLKVKALLRLWQERFPQGDICPNCVEETKERISAVVGICKELYKYDLVSFRADDFKAVPRAERENYINAKANQEGESWAGDMNLIERVGKALEAKPTELEVMGEDFPSSPAMRDANNKATALWPEFIRSIPTGIYTAVGLTIPAAPSQFQLQRLRKLQVWLTHGAAVLSDLRYDWKYRETAWKLFLSWRRDAQVATLEYLREANDSLGSAIQQDREYWRAYPTRQSYRGGCLARVIRREPQERKKGKKVKKAKRHKHKDTRQKEGEDTESVPDRRSHHPECPARQSDPSSDSAMEKGDMVG